MIKRQSEDSLESNVLNTIDKSATDQKVNSVNIIVRSHGRGWIIS